MWGAFGECWLRLLQKKLRRMSCSKSFHQTAFHVKGNCCATCHGKHVGLLHVTFGPSVRSCSARRWEFEWVPGGVFNPLAGLEVQKGNHQASSIKPSFDPCPTFRQLFYKTARCHRCSCAFFGQRKCSRKLAKTDLKHFSRGSYVLAMLHAAKPSRKLVRRCFRFSWQDMGWTCPKMKALRSSLQYKQFKSLDLESV